MKFGISAGEAHEFNELFSFFFQTLLINIQYPKYKQSIKNWVNLKTKCVCEVIDTQTFFFKMYHFGAKVISCYPCKTEREYLLKVLLCKLFGNEK